MYDWLQNPEIDKGAWFLTDFRVFWAFSNKIGQIEPHPLKLSKIVHIQVVVTLTQQK